MRETQRGKERERLEKCFLKTYFSFYLPMTYYTSYLSGKMKTMWRPDHVKRIPDCVLKSFKRLQ